MNRLGERQGGEKPRRSRPGRMEGISHRGWRRNGAIVAVCLVVFALGVGRGADARDGGSDEGGGPFGDPGQALIRIVHASPDAPALDLYAGDSVVASGLVAGDATGFLPVPDGEQGLRFVPAGGTVDSAIVETRFELVDGGAYEVVVLGQLREIDGRIYEIDRTRMESPGMARVRFLHLSPDADELDLVAGEETRIFEGADFADATGYVEIDAGTYALSLQSSDPADVATNAAALAESELVLDEGEVYDILGIGLTQDATFGLLPLSATTEFQCGAVLVGGGGTDGCVRVVHASADTPTFDVLIDDGETPMVAGVEFASGSSFVPVSPGKHSVKLVATDLDSDEPLRETKFEIDAGTAYDLVAVDLRAQLDVRVVALDLSPLGAGQARLKMAHAMPNQSGLTLGLINGEAIFGDIRFPDVSPSLELPAGVLDLEIRTATDEAVILATVTELDLAPGSVSVLYIIGVGDGTVAEVLTLTSPTQRMVAEPPPVQQ